MGMTTPKGRGLGYRPSVKDGSEPKYHEIYEVKERVPTSVDERGWCTPVRNQEDTGECTAFGGCGAFELARNELANADNPTYLSTNFLYWEETDLEGDPGNLQAGAEPQDTCKVTATLGLPPEADDPWSETSCPQPSATAATDAAGNKAANYASIESLTALKTAVATLGQGVIIGIVVYPSFESENADSTGYIPMPSQTDLEQGPLGGHCVAVVGYNDILTANGVTGYLIFKNSWGTSWGAAGYGYLPYGYVEDSALTPDMWAIVLPAPSPSPSPTPVPPTPTPTPVPPSPDPVITLEPGPMSSGMLAYIESQTDGNSNALLMAVAGPSYFIGMSDGSFPQGERAWATDETGVMQEIFAYDPDGSGYTFYSSVVGPVTSSTPMLSILLRNERFMKALEAYVEKVLGNTLATGFEVAAGRPS